VQVAMQQRGAPAGAPFGRFSRLRFANRSVVASRRNNIYFFVARPLRRVLVGLFPAVLAAHGGGLFCSTSDDGLHWARPRRVLQSRVSDGVRVGDWPVELTRVRTRRAADERVETVRLVLQHHVYLHTGGIADACHRTYQRLDQPILCDYRIRLRMDDRRDVCEQLERSFSARPNSAAQAMADDRSDTAASDAHMCEERAAAEREAKGKAPAAPGHSFA
jgi:hypothetical protein